MHRAITPGGDFFHSPALFLTALNMIGSVVISIVVVNNITHSQSYISERKFGLLYIRCSYETSCKKFLFSFNPGIFSPGGSAESRILDQRIASLFLLIKWIEYLDPVSSIQYPASVRVVHHSFELAAKPCPKHNEILKTAINLRRTEQRRSYLSPR